MSTRSRRAPGSPPDKCTCRTPSSAASRKTRSQVAVSSSSSLASSASGFEQYGQPSGQRWVSSARSPRGLCSIAEPAKAAWSEGSSVTLSQLQKPLVGQAAQQRAHIGENFLTRRRIALREVVDDLAESDLAGAAPDDLGRDRVGLEHPLRRKQDPAALRLVVDEPHAARQSRPRLGRDDGARIAQAALLSCGTKAPGGICFGAT